MDILKDVEGDWNTLMSDDDFVKGVSYFFTCNIWRLHAEEEFHNKSFDNFPIEVTLPNLTNENVNTSIELIPAWTYEDKTTNNNP